nr:PIN domain-containing protein [Cupriavidus necator]
MARGRVGAIAIDTNVFDEEGQNIHDGNLPLLRQVEQAGKRLLVPDVIAREMESHLREKFGQEKAFDSKVLKHLKKFAADEVVSAVARAIHEHDRDAKKALDAFFANVTATVIQASDYTSLESVMDRYFASEPPFEPGGKKKAEFPDAIALLSLEGWANKNDTKVLCVTKDGDWERYSNQSDRLLITPELEDVLAALVLVRGEKLPDRVRAAAAIWLESEAAKEKIEASIQFHLDDHSPFVDADSYCGFNDEVVELYPKRGSLAIDAANVAVLSADHSDAVISVSVDFVAKGRFSFDFFVPDSIDKDDVPVGHAYATSETEVRADLSIGLYLEDFAADETQVLSADDVTEITVKMSGLHFDVGTIGPDYSNDAPD